MWRQRETHGQKRRTVAEIKLSVFVCECVCRWAGLLHQSNTKSPGQELRLSTFKPPWASVNWLAYTMPRQTIYTEGRAAVTVKVNQRHKKTF